MTKGKSSALVVVLMLALAALACARGGDPTPLEHGREAEFLAGTLEHGDRQRHYLLRLPAGYHTEGSYPLVLALHGGGGSGERMCSLEAGIQTLADEEGFLVLCPDGVDEHWNDGRQIEEYIAHEQEVDDVGFLMWLLERTIEVHAVDPAQVFVTGFSNGGMMAFRLACERADRFAAIAPSIANMPQDLDCQPAQPMPVMILNGTEDPLMPFDGGQVGARRNPLGPVLSTEASAEFWAAHNGCDLEPAEETLPVQQPDDGTRIHKRTYRNCRAGAEVILYIVEGGGHTWPGGPQYAPEIVIGPTSNQANAAELIWTFFEANNGP